MHDLDNFQCYCLLEEVITVVKYVLFCTSLLVCVIKAGSGAPFYCAYKAKRASFSTFFYHNFLEQQFDVFETSPSLHL